MGTARALGLVAIAMIAGACRSRALDPASGSGTIAVDGGAGVGGRGDAAIGTPRAFPLGVICGQPSDCSSGFCEDGVCCTKACVGSCVSCTVAGSVGVCTPAPAGAQARTGGCVVEADLPCGYDGTCDGAGACQLAISGTPCARGRCDLTTISGVKVCDGQGACLELPSLSCDEGYGCDPVTLTCRTSCATDGGCPGREAGTDVGPSSGDAARD